MEIPFSSLKSDDVNGILDHLHITGDSRELAVKSSSGSVSFAMMLSEDGILDSFIEICSEISQYIDDRKSLQLDLSKITKSVDAGDMLTVFLNIYRHMLVSHITGKAVEEGFADADIRDIEKLSKIIKIFLALREGLSNNLNIRNSLKGMLYSLDDMAQTGIPELDLSFAH